MELSHESDLLAIINLSCSFDRHAHVVMGYCYLFGVSPLKMKAKKLRLLLLELKRLFDAEAFTYDRRKYVISRAGIAEALDIMVKRSFTKPLNNHNYLKLVMVDIAEREYQDRSRQGEKELRKRENAVMAGNRPALPRLPGDGATGTEGGQIWGQISNLPPDIPDIRSGDDHSNSNPHHVKNRGPYCEYPKAEEQVEPPPPQLTEAQRRANLARVANILKGLDK